MSRTTLACSVFIVACSFSLIAAQQPAVAVPKSALFDSSALVNDLKTLSADDMQGRQVGTAGGEKARAFVVARFKAAGIQPFGASYESSFTFTAGRGATQTERTGVNVIGHIDGSRTPRRYIVVSAHYDHIGLRNGEVANGADDNASGTAALFSVAQYFKAHRPANSIVFVAFDGEESGLQGAKAFVKAPPVDVASLAVNLNMDMIGRDPDDKLFVVGTLLQPSLKPFIERIAAKAPVKLLMGHDDPAQKGVEDWTKDSDHYAFITAKIPALYFGVEDFAQHHKVTDDFETMTHPFYVHAVETMVQAVLDFDAHLGDLPRRDASAPRPDERTVRPQGPSY
jgi:Zn-dependent M28 family amino/carboxypeptidase